MPSESRLRWIDKRYVYILPRLELEARGLFQMEGHRAFGNFFTAPESTLVGRHRKNLPTGPAAAVLVRSFRGLSAASDIVFDFITSARMIGTVSWLNNPFVPPKKTTVMGARRCWRLSYSICWRGPQTPLSR